MAAAKSVSFGRTEIGLVREENQDQYFIAELSRSMNVLSNSMKVDDRSQLRGGELGYLFLVADGMGGHRGGREASQQAIRYFVNSILNSVRWIVKIDEASEQRFLSDLQSMLSSAHRAIQQQAKKDPDLHGMGTTLTMAYVAWPRLLVVHAGDTRCYLMRDGELKLITKDHTVANQLIESGRLSPESESRSPWSNVLVNALGAGAEDVVADIYQFDLQLGDRLLMCSDGLNKHVDENFIRRTLSDLSSSEDATNQLVEAALADGGTDNITVVVADFVADESYNRMVVHQSQKKNETPLYECQLPAEEVDTNSDLPAATESFIEEHPTSEFL